MDRIRPADAALNSASRVNPLLGRRLSSPALTDAVFETVFTTGQVPFLADSRCGDVPALPVSCYLTLILHAAQQSLSVKRCAVDDVAFVKALAVPPHAGRPLQLILSIGDGLGEYFKIVGRESADGASDETWITHAMGSLVRLSEEPPTVDPTSWDALRGQTRPLSSEEVYETLSLHNLHLGGAARAITSLWKNETTALAQVRLPRASGDAATLPIHPLLLEAGLQTAQLLTPGRPGHCLLPTSLERLSFFAPPSSANLWCHARQRPTEGDGPTFDLGLYEDDGCAIAILQGVTFEYLPSEVLQSVLKESLGTDGANAKPASDSPARIAFLRRVRELTPARRPGVVLELICQTAGELLAQSAPKPLRPELGFVEAGLDSVRITQLCARLELVFQCRVPPTLAFKYSTPESLAAFLCRELVDLHELAEQAASPAEPGPRVEQETEANDGPTPLAAARSMNSSQTVRREPIAIIGMACRFPGGANSPDEFWRLLRDGVDAVQEIPQSRWNLAEYARAGGCDLNALYAHHAGLLELSEIEAFDPQFFGIAPREADAIDPQQRKLLEVSWEALEHAGLPVRDLKGSRTGVFFGSSTDDYLQLFNNLASPAGIDARTSLGTSRAIAAGRLAYALGLHGPAVQLDTACSSSLAAVHLACQSLLLGDCDLALAGAVNLLLSPVWMFSLCELKALCPDGRCKTFDAQANGFVRAEGCAVVALKRLSDAQRDGDRILGQIVGSAVNHDGRSSGMTVPNEQAQEQLLRQALQSAGLQPGDVSYIEAHGTGTSLGDPIEMGALRSVYAPGRSEDQPLIVGSVKSNIGHLEAAAGMAGLLKVVEALKHHEIPANLHFHQPNPLIPWDGFPVRVADRRLPWTSPRRIAGISSFGFSGTNAHVLIEGPPEAVPLASQHRRPLEILPLSADNEQSLHELMQRYAEFLSHDEVVLADVAYTAAAGRSHFNQRTAIIAGSIDEAIAKLHSPGAGVFRSTPESSTGGLAFVFPETSAEFIDAGRELLELLPAFRRELQTLESVFGTALGSSLSSLLAGDASEWQRTRPELLPPVVFTLQLALARVWHAWGLRSTAVTGWGVGEIAAACHAGVVSPADGLKLVMERGRSNQARWADVVRTISFQPPTVDVISATTGVIESGKIGSSKDWIQRTPAAELTNTGMAGLRQFGCETLLEIGPGSAPAGNGSQQTVSQQTVQPLQLASLAIQAPTWPVLLQTLAELYVRGFDLDWKNFYRDSPRRKCSLPTYPFRRRRHWMDHLPEAPRSAAGHSLLGQPIRRSDAEVVFESLLDLRQIPLVGDHRVLGKAVMPATAYLEMAVAAYGQAAAEAPQRPVIERLSIPQALVLTETESLNVRTTLTRTGEGWDFLVQSQPVGKDSQTTEWTRHAAAKLVAVEGVRPARGNVSELQAACAQPVAVDQHYQSIRRQGLQYGPLFQAMTQLSLGRSESLARVCLPAPLAASNEFELHPVLLDASLQPLTALLPLENTYMPVGIGRLECHAAPGPEVWSHVRLQDVPGNDRRTLTADITLLDDQGETVVAITGLKLRQIEAKPAGTPQSRDWLYRVDWQPQSERAPFIPQPTGNWLIFADDGNLASGFRQHVDQAGGRCITVFPGKDYLRCSPDEYEVNPDRPDDFQRLLAESARDQAPLSGIVHLWSLRPHDLEEQSLSCKSVLHLVQALVGRSLSVPLWLVTRGVQAIGETDTVDVSQSPLWGLGRVIALEHPELRCVRSDCDPDPNADNVAALVQETFGADQEPETAWRGGVRHVARLVTHRPAEKPQFQRLETPFRVQLAEFGVFEKFRAVPIERRAPLPNEVEVEVAAVGLNFRDVLRALGMLRNYEQQAGITTATDAPFGFECSGTIVAIGTAVRDLAVGDRVIVCAAGCLSSHLTVKRSEVARIPAAVDFTAAAAAPVAFMTAHHALIDLAQLQPGQRVLIHAAAGGVGQAAVRIAQALGAEIFATASPGKWELLKSQGIAHVLNSRSTSFADDIHRLTNGCGVDVVLNSLNGEFIPASFRSLAPNGVFIEIGKIDTWTSAQAAQARPDVRYFKFDLGEEDQKRPGFMGRLLTEVADNYLTSRTEPLPIRVFPLEQVADGFRWMARAQHVGKIVFELNQSRAAASRSPNTCLITGGLGALGKLVARWAVERGATHLALVGRSANDARYQKFLRDLEAAGAIVRVFSADVSQREELQSVLDAVSDTMPPLRGIVHAAAVLDDGVLERQDWQRFERVLAPKAYGAWRLHELTHHLPLDYFICFSSASSLTGWAGQGNYAAANAALDALAHHRRALGLPGLSLNWGPWGGAGMASTLSARDQARLTDAGLQTIDPALGLETLSALVSAEDAQLAVLPVDWEKFGRFLGRNPLWSSLMQAVQATPVPQQSAFLEKLRAAPPAERPRLLRDQLRSEVITVLGLDPTRAVPTNVGFTDLGMDSLTSAEFRTRLQSVLSCALSTTLTFDHPTLEALTTYLLKEKIVSEQPPKPTPLPASPPAAPARDEREAIAVIGMSCRMPGGGDTPEAYWDILRRGDEAIREVPADRWDINAYYDSDPDAPGKMWTRSGGFVNQVAEFDAPFFGIMPKEAHALDPQQRLLLELAYEALEDAGVAVESVAGTEFGVFMGICGSDYLVLSMRDARQIDAYLGTGTTHSPAAGRIAYTFGLRGPAVAVDTACSSALVALHFACQSLRSGECDLAFAGGVNLILAPEMSINFTKARMLSRDGHCKTFDAAADGYVRGEGGGMVLLKRLSQAQADGDRILAVIRGTAVNQDGRSSGLTAPNGPAQAEVIRRALSSAGVEPGEISYLEAHGTGTSLGDPIELGAVGEVFGPRRDTPLIVGSVKTNIGHLETASGMAGLIKVILAMRNELIPKHLHFTTPNPKVAWSEIPVEVPVEARPWPKGNQPRRAGVSSFGFSGTNAHVVVEEAPAAPLVQEKSPPAERPLSILPLSGKSEQSLNELAAAYETLLSAGDERNLANVCHTASAGRSHWSRRAALVGSSREELQTQLANFRAGKLGVATGQADEPPDVAMLFTGQGSQFTGMGRILYETQPTFRRALERCDELLYSIRRKSLLSVIYPESNSGLLDQTEWTQPALFSLEYALLELWKSWGVAPAAVLGHSVGEYTAALAAGVFSLEDGLKLIAARGRLIQSLPTGGGMCVVMADEETVRQAISGRERDVSIAAINGPRQIVISGPESALAPIVADLESRQISTTRLPVSHAFHSQLMEPILDEFSRAAAGITYSPPQIPLISNVTGTIAGSEIASPDYWRDHIRRPVQFTRGIAALAGRPNQVFLEIGPNPVLSGLGKRCCDDAKLLWLASLQKNTPDWQTMLSSLAQLYVRGAAIDWAGFDHDYHRRKVSIPHYPFQRKRYWLQTRKLPASGTKAALPQGNGAALHPLLGQRVALAAGDVVFSSLLSAESPAFLADHGVFGRPIFPATAYLETALAAGHAVSNGKSVVVEDLSLIQPLALPPGANKTVQLALESANGQQNFRYFSQDETSASKGDAAWVQHASGRIAFTDAPTARTLDGAAIRARCAEPVPREELYARFAGMGLEYGPCFQGVKQVWRGTGEALGEIEMPAPLAADALQYHVHPAILDAAIQVLAAALPESAETYLPVGVERLVPTRPLPERLFSHVRLRDPDETGAEFILADIKLIDSANHLLAVVEGLRLKRVAGVPAPVARITSEAEAWLHQVVWRSRPAPESQEFPAQGKWLIVGEDGEFARQLVAKLAEQGQTPVAAYFGEQFAQDSGDRYRLNPHNPSDFTRWLGQVCPRQETIAGIILAAGGSAASSDIQPPNWPLQGCESALHLLQAMKQSGLSARLWLLTRGAQPVTASDVVDPFQATIWGLGRVIGTENPDLECIRFDTDPADDAVTSVGQLLCELANGVDATITERELAYRQGQRFVPRLVNSAVAASGSLAVPSAAYRLHLPTYGRFDDFRLTSIERTPPGPGKVEIEVQAAGLNFRDVLRALGMLQEYEIPIGITSANEAPFGFESAGKVTAVGPGVTHLKVGDDVLALGPGAIRSHLVLDAGHVAVKPQNLSMVEAASVPLAFLTALYGLENLAQSKRGDRVLIHAAAGGVGQAAVQIAQRLGAEVYATASPKKWDFLRQQGIRHVFNSRSTDFVEELLAVTNGQGVDVVLNSLNGEMIDASAKVLGRGGRFIEIGKIGIWTQEQFHEARPDARYYAFDLGEAEAAEPGLIQSLLSVLTTRFAQLELLPLPLKEYAIEDAVAAFREMQQARHLGKLVLNLAGRAGSNQPVVRGDASYLITGGLGGLGLEVARWIVQQGGKHLVLTGRRGADTPEKQAVVRELERAGATVQAVAADVAQAEDVARMIGAAGQMSPLRGVIHAAGVLDDGLLTQQTWQRFQRVLAPKLAGAWQLDRQTADAELDFFVCFSSVASLLGSPGQGNYAAANAFLDGLASRRRAAGLPAVSIHWGPWSGSGMAARLEERDRARMEKSGWSLLSVAQGLAALDRILSTPGAAQIGVLPVDWQTLTATNGPLALLDELTATASGDEVQSDLSATLLTASVEERRELLTTFVRKEIAAVLACDSPEAIQPRDRLLDLGMDSLTAVELKNGIARELGLQVPSTLAFDYPTVEAMTEFLLGQLPERQAATPVVVKAEPAIAPKPPKPVAPQPVTPPPAAVAMPIANKTPSVAVKQSISATPPVPSENVVTPPKTAAAKPQALDRTQEKDLQTFSAEPIAIIGIGCRIPGGGDTPEAVWQMLRSGVSAVSEIPADRWDMDKFYDPDRGAPGNKIYSRHGNFLRDVASFDPDFFGIAPLEANTMDPQQRLLLETTWEALENAGCAPDGLYRSRTGVFIGISNLDYARQITLSGMKIEAHMGTGNSPSAAAGRLSYNFGLQGPSLAVDTACSSSLVSVHLACQSLRKQECELALAGGVNLMLCPITSVIFAKSRMLSADGRCKTFDAAADGYGRGEGAGILVLKRLSDAERDGDRIIALIRGSAVNQDGPSGGLTAPNGPSQQQVIRDALTNAGVPANDVAYIEAHGTGTSLGDPIEVGALGAVFGAVRTKQDPLLVGTVKSNVGHLESAAGVAGLIKAALMLQHGELAPNLNFETPNPHIPWGQLPIHVVTELQAWPAGRPRVIGVSSFGFTGTNAHILLAAAPQAAPHSGNPAGSSPQPELLVLSARTEGALQELATRHADYLEQHPAVSLADAAFTLATGRTRFEQRLAVVADSVRDAARQLRDAGKLSPRRAGKAPPKVAFLFSASTVIAAGTGKELFDNQPVFRQTLEQCDEILWRTAGWSLLDRLYGNARFAGEAPDQSDVAAFSVEYALARLWLAWGITPTAVAGFGVGELAAACIAGVFDLEAGLMLVSGRGQPAPAVAGVRRNGHHAQQDNTLLTATRRGDDSIQCQRPRLMLITAATGKPLGDEALSAEYWRERASHTATAARNSEGWNPADGSLVLEIGGPSAAGQEFRRNGSEAKSTRFASLKPGHSDLATMLSSLGTLFTHGANVAWNAVFAGRVCRKIELPTYAFQRQRCWFDLSESRAAAPRAISGHPLLGSRLPSAAREIQFQAELRLESLPLLHDHRLADVAVLPASAYLEIGLAAARSVLPEDLTGLTLREISFQQLLKLPAGVPQTVQTILTPREAGFQLEFHSLDSSTSQWRLHASALLEADVSDDGARLVDRHALLQQIREPVDVEELYRRFERLGLNYGPRFRTLRQVWRAAGEALAESHAIPAADESADDYLAHPALLDACFQALAVAPGGDQDGTYLPVGLERLTVYGRFPDRVWSHVTVQEAHAAVVIANAETFDADGTLLAQLEGLRLQRLPGVAKPVQASKNPFRRAAPDRPEATVAISQRADELANQVKAAAGAARRPLLIDYLQEEVAAVLRRTSGPKPDPEKTFQEMGMDSLMGVDFIYRIRKGLGIALPAETLLTQPTISRLADELLRQLNQMPQEGVAAEETLAEEIDPANPFLEPLETESPWVKIPHPSSTARVRLFCFPPIAGGASMYEKLARQLPPEIELCAIQLPGREERAHEPAVTDVAELLETLTTELLEFLDRPFAFFGHSGGNVLSFELAHRVQQRYGLRPAVLFVGAFWSPEQAIPITSEPAVLIEKLKHPQTLLQPRGASAAGLATVTADVDLFSTYRYRERPPLKCPLVVFGGEQDEIVSPDELEDWSRYTQGEFRLELLPGSHSSYLADPRLMPLVAEEILQRLPAGS